MIIITLFDISVKVDNDRKHVYNNNSKGVGLYPFYCSSKSNHMVLVL